MEQEQIPCMNHWMCRELVFSIWLLQLAVR